jgi:hypothetical protein
MLFCDRLGHHRADGDRGSQDRCWILDDEQHAPGRYPDPARAERAHTVDTLDTQNRA